VRFGLRESRKAVHARDGKQGYLLEKAPDSVLVHASILLSIATMKVPKTFEDLCKQRAAQRRRDMADLRSGRATAEEIYERNSWFSKRQFIQFDVKKLSESLERTA
jgi:hypothetical protein